MGVPDLSKPGDPNSVARWSREVTRELNGGIDFGDPTHPVDESTRPNGLTDNVRGSWVKVEFDAADTATTCTHNLGVPTTGTATNTLPNVVWLVFGIHHNGTGTTGAGDTLSVSYEEGDTIGEDAIQLRLHAANRTVSGAHPVTVVLFFLPATPWP